MTQFYVVDTAQNVYPLDIYQEAVSENVRVTTAYNPIFDVLVQAALKHTASLSNNQNANAVAASIVKSREATNIGGGIYWEDLLSTAKPGVTLSFVPVVLVSEFIGALETPLIYGYSQWQFADSLSVAQSLVGAYVKQVNDLLKLTAVQTSVPVWIVNASLKVSSSTTNEAILNLLFKEYAAFLAAITTTLSLRISDLLTVTGSTQDVIRKLLAIKEQVVNSGLATSQYEANVILREAAKLAYQLLSGKGASITEQVKLLAAYTAIFGFAGHASDGVLIRGLPTPSLVFEVEVSDVAEIIDPAGAVGGFDPTQFLGLLLSEKVTVKIGYNANDGSWVGWVLNTQNSAVTNYAGWSFNSFAMINGVPVGASSTGLCTLGGATDNALPINAAVTFAKSDMGDSRLKRVQNAYIGVRTGGELYFITNTDDGIQRVYSLVSNAPGVHTERVQMARGVKSRYWQFSLQNVSGADFRIDELELIPVVLSRRV